MSVLITPDRWQALERQRKNQPAVREGWVRFEARAKDLAGPGLVERTRVREAWASEHAAKPGYTYPNFLHRMAQDAVRLAFHHRLTHDPASLNGSRTLLGWMLDWPVWNAQAPRNGWRSDLWTAEGAALVGLVLDLLGEALPEPERRAGERAVWERGVKPVLEEWLEPGRRLHALDSMGHNWWSVCVSGAALGLFAVREQVPEAAAWLERIAQSVIEFFHYPGNLLQNKQRTFGAGGDFIESVGYLDYTLHHLTVLFDVYRQQEGRDLPAELPMLGPICDYYLSLIQPLSGRFQRINFGDMGSGPDTMGSYEHRPLSVWLWLAGEYRRNDLFHLARRVLPAPDDVWELLFWPEALAGSGFAGAPGDRVFENSGVAVLRDGYHDEASVLAIKTGEKWNHNQSDAGSFILSSRGVEFFSDPGTTEYSSPLHASYFKSSRAHNVTLHDGKGQRDDLDDLGTRSMGRIGTRLLAPGYKYLLADATGPWEGVYRRYYRHVLWLGDVVILVDDLMAWTEGAWTSLFHYEGQAEPTPTGFVVRNQGLELAAHVIAAGPLVVEGARGYASRMVSDPFKNLYTITDQPYLQVRLPADGVRQKIMTVFVLPGSGVEQVEPMRANHLTGVRIRDGRGEWEVVCNHRADGSVMHLNSDLTHGPLRTDAFLAALHRDPAGGLDAAALHNGSYLHLEERVLYSALLKSDALWTCADQVVTLHTQLSAPAWADVAKADGALARVQVPAGASSIRP